MPLELSVAKISAGWQLGDPFAAQSGIVSVAAGAGVLAVPPQIVVAWNVPPRARLLLVELGLRIVDQAGFDQIFFALRNNQQPQAPFDQINGQQMNAWNTLEVDTEYGPGGFDIAATNISGTGWPGANLNPGPINVICRAKGWLLRQV